MTPEEAYEFFKPYINDRCVVCDAWPLMLCDSDTVWVHSRRIAVLNRKIPSEVLYKARSKPRPVNPEPEESMDIYYYGYEYLGGPKVVRRFTGDRNFIGKFAEEFFSTNYFYVSKEETHALDQTEERRTQMLKASLYSGRTSR